MLMGRVIVYLFLIFLSCLNVDGQLKCLTGYKFAGNNPTNITTCNAGHQCTKIEAGLSLLPGQSPHMVDIYSCRIEESCNDGSSCEEYLTSTLLQDGFAVQPGLIVSRCEQVCCNNVLCNNQTVAEIRKQNLETTVTVQLHSSAATVDPKQTTTTTLSADAEDTTSIRVSVGAKDTKSTTPGRGRGSRCIAMKLLTIVTVIASVLLL